MRSPEFRLLCDVANASKHAVLRPRRADRQQPLISEASQVEQQRFWSGGIAGEAPAMSGPAGVVRTLGPPIVVVAPCGEGPYPLDAPVITCHAMWCAMLSLTMAPLA